MRTIPGDVAGYKNNCEWINENNHRYYKPVWIALRKGLFISSNSCLRLLRRRMRNYYPEYKDVLYVELPLTSPRP